MHGCEDVRRQIGVDGPATVFVTLNWRPRSACAAVAPMRTRTVGRTASSSASSQGLHAGELGRFGFWWIRRFPAPPT